MKCKEEKSTEIKLKVLQWFIHMILESDKEIKKNFYVEGTKIDI